MDVTMTPIGTMRTPFGATGEIPKGLDAEHDAEGVIEIDPSFEAGLQDIEGFSHLTSCGTFIAPAGTTSSRTRRATTGRTACFATRSPRRPSPIGLTVVQLLRRDGTRLHVRGVDMLDGTPVLDIKPYLSSIPADDIERGWLAAAEERRSNDLIGPRTTTRTTTRTAAQPEKRNAASSMTGGPPTRSTPGRGPCARSEERPCLE